MAGLYIEGQSQELSGVYSLVQAASSQGPSAAIGVAAFPFTANWGPINQLLPYASAKDFNDAYNAGVTGFTAKKVNDLAYADATYKPNSLLGYRLAVAAAAKGTAILPVASGTTWTLETLYHSDRAFSVAVKPGLASGTTRLELTEGGVLLWADESDTIAGLAAKITASPYIRVKVQGTNLPSNSAGVAFTGGNNGAVPTVTEYSTFLTEVEVDASANAVALDGVTDEAVLTVFETWVKRVRDEGLYLEGFRGGLATWDSDLTLPNAKSVAINYRGMINVGNGCDGYTSADMAIYLAAYACSRPLNTSVTDQVTPFVKVNSKAPLTKANRILAKQKGTLLFVMKGGKVVIDEGVNTLSAPTGDEKAEMKKMRVSRIIDYVNRATETFGDEYKKTKSNTQAARQAFAAVVEDAFFRGLAQDEIIQPTYSYREDSDYHGDKASHTARIDEAFFYCEYWPTDSMEKIYQKFGVRF
ncbi:phage tail sheath subtilisin-like domain-containing protein [Paenibacillus sp. MMO-177]|uniref:phage tail sheath subtilisin-like domain-containing protein n=1 Tax=Paenibacillus sp. MMO-177 TaxID=3081289 RepID=UPI003019D8D1